MRSLLTEEIENVLPKLEPLEASSHQVTCDSGLEICPARGKSSRFLRQITEESNQVDGPDFNVLKQTECQAENRLKPPLDGTLLNHPVKILLSLPSAHNCLKDLSIAGPVFTQEVMENILQLICGNLKLLDSGSGLSTTNSDESRGTALPSNQTSVGLDLESTPAAEAQHFPDGAQPASDRSLQVSEPAACQPQVTATVDDVEADQDIVKKTVVEAFVKMVVCRKVTVQTVNIKTGQILDTKTKTEEEEPVILGVDCVETTEDLTLSGQQQQPAASNPSSSESLPSKWAASLDGGLKFLSAVSESRPKIGKSSAASASRLPTDTGTSSSLTEGSTQTTYAVVSTMPEVDCATQLKMEPKSDSESEWYEELNDDVSEDYIPEMSRGSAVKSVLSHSRLNVKSENNIVSSINCNGTDKFFFHQKKRGRKRKWDNTIGIASNLRTCQFCNKHFSNSSICAKHMKKGACVSAVFCYICCKPFTSEQLLETHLLMHGSEASSGDFECKDCNRSYRTRSGYMKHFRMGSCSKRDDFEDGCSGEFSCDLCESRFSTDAYLKLHRYKVHENPKDTHTCSDCGKRFYSFQGFSKHRQGRPCTEPLKCHICGKTYSSKAKESFKIHMKHHGSEVSGVTFQCDECERSYMTQVALNKHKFSHTGVKPYQCNICGKGFSMRYMVKDHARTHTGERPFICNLCGGAFNNKGHLGRHLRSHENGTLMKRGRPKKVRGQEEAELRLIEFGQTLHSFGGQTIQVVESQMLEPIGNGAPMIIQANNKTIIITTEGWPSGKDGSAALVQQVSTAGNPSSG